MGRGKDTDLTGSILDLFRSNLAPSREVSADGASLVRLIDKPDGWQQFLKKVGPETFTKSFSPFHVEFWEWYWRLTYLRRNGMSLTNETLTFLAAWPRGGGKSSAIEWACLVEGAMGLPGYVLYISLTQTSAESHVSDIRKRLESERIAQFFPDLAEPKMGKHHTRYGWRQNFLMTKGGWAIRPVGLDVAVRGLKESDLRPTLIVFDDIDTYKIAPETVKTNLETISRDILGAGTPSTIHLVAQNLIAEHCAVNQIVTGRTDVLSDHVPSVHKAFEELVVEKRIDRKSGEPAYVIQSAVPTWPDFDMEAAKTSLNKLGYEAFMAEYQHDFSLDKSERVIPEYAEDLHVITWDDFETMFGIRRIPDHWQIGVGLDIGFTEKHISAWSWIAVSAEDSELPNAYFRFRVKTFVGESINQQAVSVMAEIVGTREDGVPYDERDQYVVRVMSHEQAGSRMILNREYNLQMSECKFGKEDGVHQWRSLLRVDAKQPHPFKPDVQDQKTGLWTLGRPSYFDVVIPEELTIPKTDAGLAIPRAQLLNWKRRRVKMTEAGITDDRPMKIDDDTIDATRMILAESSLSPTPLTDHQRRMNLLKEMVGEDNLILQKGRDDYMGVLLRRHMDYQVLREKEREEEAEVQRIVSAVLKAPEYRRRG